jgi:predicted transcriptional regulator
LVQYRSTVAIIKSVLESIHQDRWLSASEIAVHAKIPYKRLTPRLDHMVKIGLIEEREEVDFIGKESNKVYILTDKGQQVLFRLREFAAYFAHLDVPLIYREITSEF